MSMQGCYNCSYSGKLIWGGDHDDKEMIDGPMIVTNLSCPDCDTQYHVYTNATKGFKKRK